MSELEIERVIKKRRHRLSRKQVAEALKDVEPGRISIHVVEVDGTDYPVKQVYALATGRDVLDFDTTQARSALLALGMVVKRVG